MISQSDQFGYMARYFSFCKLNFTMATKRKVAKKSTVKKGSKKKNKLGVKNSLVNNINARKEKGVSRSKKRSTIEKKQYKKMQDNWE
jgi:hypothetical protein